MVLFGLALGILELIFLGAFFLLLIVGVTFDRRGKEDVKWWVFAGGALMFALWQWSSWTFSGVWEAITSWTFWEPIGYYLLAGLAYSLLEFFLDVRRSARFYSAEWQKHLNGYDEVPVLDGADQPVPNPNADSFGNSKFMTRRRPNSEVYEEVKNKGANSGLFNTALRLTREFVGQYNFRNRIIEIQISSDKVSVEPKVDKVELADHITAWTFLWPAYAVSLILGDLLVEVFNALASLLAKVSGQFVKISFANVFKF